MRALLRVRARGRTLSGSSNPSALRPGPGRVMFCFSFAHSRMRVCFWLLLVPDCVEASEQSTLACPGSSREPSAAAGVAAPTAATDYEVSVREPSAIARDSTDQLTAAESVTVLPGLGMQVSTVSRRFFRQVRRTRFVPSRDVESVIIHEGLSKWNVHYYLGIVTGKPNSSDDKNQDNGRIVVAFEVS